MAEKAAVKTFGAVQDGSADWDTIRKNFNELEAKINEHANELKALAQHETSTVSMLFETQGIHTMLAGGKHKRCKVTNAYAQVHDNIDAEVVVSLLGMEVKFSSTEKKGSAKSFDSSGEYLLRDLNFIDHLEVELSYARRISVNVTLESTEFLTESE
ncbi:MAG TPA: hypothetical protein VN368_00980 [Candidatus Methylomirabilis sp.]|nr:hypothetical protein [Candidatus Methylomirabilis sp.]